MNAHESPIKNKRLIIVSFVLIAFLLLIEFNNTLVPYNNLSNENNKSGITLTILTRHSTTIQKAFEESFLKTPIAKKYNIVDIKWIKAFPTLWNSILEKNISVDIAWGGGPTIYEYLNEAGYIEPIEPDLLPELSNVSDSLGMIPLKEYNKKGNLLWVKTAISSFGITINKKFLKVNNLTEPHSWIDLAMPTFGKLLPTPTVAIGNPPYTSSNTRIYEIILSKYGWSLGWSILARIAGNSMIYDGSAEAQSAVETGDVGAAISIDFYGYTSQEKNPDCKYILPENETIINGDPIALLKTTTHKQQALVFINWILSLNAQALWLKEEINRLPIRESVFRETEIGRSRKDLYETFNKTIHVKSLSFNYTLARLYDLSIRFYFEAVFTDIHDVLVNVWKKIVSAYISGRINKTIFDNLCEKLGAPISWKNGSKTYIFTKTYAIEINEKIQHDSALIQKLQKIWSEAAINQYNSLLDMLDKYL